MRPHICLLFAALVSCSDPCVGRDTECPATTSATTSDDTTAGECLPAEDGKPYGPCPNACGGVPGVVCLQDKGTVCAQTCLDVGDCTAVPWCTPDGGPAACVSGWCVTSCADAPCPDGMICSGPTGIFDNICLWP